MKEVKFLGFGYKFMDDNANDKVGFDDSADPDVFIEETMDKEPLEADEETASSERKSQSTSTIINEGQRKRVVTSDLDGYYTYGDLARLLGKPANNLRYLIDTFKEYLNPVPVSNNADAKRSNFKYSEQDYITLKNIISCKERGLSNAEIFNMLKEDLLSDEIKDDDYDAHVDVIGKQLLALYKKNLSERDQEVINQFTQLALKSHLELQSFIKKIDEMVTSQQEYYESEISERKNQIELLQEQNQLLREQLSDAQKTISASNSAFEKNNEVLSDACAMINDQADYIEQLKAELDDARQASEKKGFFRKLFG